MNLLVDIGNSRLKWAQQTANCLAHHGAVSRDGAALQALLDKNWTDMVTPEQILVSNVAGSGAADDLTAWTRTKWKLTPRFATVSQSACGVTNAYRDPAQLGIDRWLAIIAAWRKCRTPVCLVDCGTALTVDAIDKDGRHLGGLILPGLELMRESLSRRAPGISTPVRPPVLSGLADNTADAVSAGCVTAMVAAIDRIADILHEKLGSGLNCLITGGDADYLLRYIAAGETGSGFRHVPHIVLEGLATLYGGDST